VSVYRVPCPADYNNDGQIDFIDIVAFLNLFNSQDPGADLNADHAWDFLDISVFIQAISAGCP